MSAAESALASAVRGNLEAVRERIARAAERAGRDSASVRLVAVSKTHPPEVVVEAVAAGVTDLGENRVQEAAAKIPQVAMLCRQRGLADPPWHMIGHLQTNKARQAARLFSSVESVDSVHLAEALDRAMGKASVGARLSVLLEVYVGDDPARSGFRPADLPQAVPAILGLPFVDVRGLMTVAPLGWDAAATRVAFRQVRDLRDSLAARWPLVHFGELSMGMTEDFEIAIEEGATIVRVGRAIFGERGSR